MKSFGITNRLDKTGGVRLPEILLRLFEIEAGDTLELQLEGDSIVMKKYPPVCVFCGSDKILGEYKNKSYCSCCADELRHYKPCIE
jgi:transcriptional pleiotropic regulator of transition state genes